MQVSLQNIFNLKLILYVGKYEVRIYFYINNLQPLSAYFNVVGNFAKIKLLQLKISVPKNLEIQRFQN